MMFRRCCPAMLAVGSIALALVPATAGEPPPDSEAARRETALAEVQEAAAFTTKVASHAYREFREAVRRSQSAPGAEADPKLLMPQFVAEWSRQLQPLLAAELQFVRRTCDPTAEQLKSITAAGDASLKQTVDEYARLQVKLHETRFRSSERTRWPDARKLTMDALAESVKRTLPADQVERYQRALDERAAARKRATVMFVVAKLDKDLLLSPEQRSKLIEVINSNWQEAWGRQIEHLEHGEHYLPVLPDDQVLPILSQAQKQVWGRRSKSRHSLGGWTGFGFVHPITEDDETPMDSDGGSP